MLTNEYEYEVDIQTKTEEAFEKGTQQGMQQGEQKKAVEAAIVAIKEFKASPEDAAEKMNAPLELVLEALKKKA